MKKLLVTICGLFALGLVNQASAFPTLSMLPASQTASNGDTVSVDLVIDGLGDYTPDSLGDYDIDIAYDMSVLSFQSYTLGTYLGDEGLFEAVDFSLGDLGGGLVNIAEVSFLTTFELDSLQPDSFTLATLDFNVNSLVDDSSTTVSIDNVWAIGDGFGLPLFLDGTNDAVISATVPEPSMFALLSLGLFGFGVARRKKA